MLTLLYYLLTCISLLPLSIIGKLTEEWEQLDNKVRFIMDVISGKLVVSNRKKMDLFNDLKKLGMS